MNKGEGATDEIRIEFEEWYRALFMRNRESELTPERMIELRGAFGDYRGYGFMHGCWIGWQGARGARV